MAEVVEVRLVKVSADEFAQCVSCSHLGNVMVIRESILEGSSILVMCRWLTPHPYRSLWDVVGCPKIKE